MLLKSVLSSLVELMMYDKTHNKHSEGVAVLLGCLCEADYEFELTAREPLPCGLNGNYRSYTSIKFTFNEGISDEELDIFNDVGFRINNVDDAMTATYYF